ncbi:MAG: hypothetical protein PWQ96_1599 [Clostridia bacterium]|jgi:hypothetical protein|nr:hypothetical protein [Clostridiales bacterium]MDK2985956.1 hypothetical protein [Clostridia bacterium]
MLLALSGPSGTGASMRYTVGIKAQTGRFKQSPCLGLLIID